MNEEKKILLNEIHLLIKKRKAKLFNELQSIYDVTKLGYYEKNINEDNLIKNFL